MPTHRFFHMRVVTKFVITLLVTTLASTAVVAGLAYYLTAHKLGSPALRDDMYIAILSESLIVGTLVAVALALLMGIVFGSRLSRRLTRLTRAVRAIEHGELSQHVAIETHDEIGQLAVEFNRMSDTLTANHKALEESREQIQRQAERLRELSVRDALTGLNNRRYFDEQGTQLFERAVRYERPLTVMIGDIDHFKKINDTWSHAMGDEVLRRIAEILTSKVRAVDLVARYGGEEFVVAFPETALAQAVATCEALRQRIESFPWDSLQPGLKVTISMGLCADIALKDIHAMVEVADSYLYKAKQSGRNRVCAADVLQEKQYSV